MSEVVNIRDKSQLTNEVSKICLERILSEISNTSVLDSTNVPGIKMFYNPGDFVIKIVLKGRTRYIPVTWAKTFEMK